MSLISWFSGTAVSLLLEISYFLTAGDLGALLRFCREGIYFSLAIGNKSLDLFTSPLPVRKEDVFTSPLPVRNDVAVTSFPGSCFMVSGDIMHQLWASRGAKSMENHWSWLPGGLLWDRDHQKRKIWLISEICCGQGRANLFVQGIFHFLHIDFLGIGWPCAFSCHLLAEWSSVSPEMALLPSKRKLLFA